MPHHDFPDDAEIAAHPPTASTRPRARRQHVRTHDRRWHVELENGHGPCFRLWITPLHEIDDPPDQDHSDDPHIYLAKANFQNNHFWRHVKRHGELRLAIRAAIQRSMT